MSELAALTQQIESDPLTKQVAYVNCISTRMAAERIWSRLPKKPPPSLEEGSAVFERICEQMMGTPENEDTTQIDRELIASDLETVAKLAGRLGYPDMATEIGALVAKYRRARNAQADNAEPS